MLARLSSSASQKRRGMPLHTMLWKLTSHLIVLGGAVVMLYPLFWLLGASFKPTNLIFTDSSLIPCSFGEQGFSCNWVWSHYTEGWNALANTFDTFFINSLVLCFLSIIGNVVSCSLAAFAFARLNFKFKTLWFVLMQGAILLPHHVSIVPQFILFNNLGWVAPDFYYSQLYLPVTLPKFLATDTFFIFMMIQFFRSIPRELDDAARVDGCNHFQIYWHILMPLSLPALATTAIFTFIWTWSDFFTQLIYISRTEFFTMPLALRAFLDSTSGSEGYGSLFAMSILSLLPILAFFIIFQRFIIEGATSSGLKG